MPFFEALVARFYAGVADDDVLRPLYPEADLAPADASADPLPRPVLGRPAHLRSRARPPAAAPATLPVRDRCHRPRPMAPAHARRARRARPASGRGRGVRDATSPWPRRRCATPIDGGATARPLRAAETCRAIAPRARSAPRGPAGGRRAPAPSPAWRRSARRASRPSSRPSRAAPRSRRSSGPRTSGRAPRVRGP